MNPDATFDCLFLADRLQAEAGDFAMAELHLFSYLACLLWLYGENAVADWGYAYVGTELGAPYSLDLDETIRRLEDSGYFMRFGPRLRMSPEVREQLVFFSGLEVNRQRSECLYAATSSIAAFSIGIVNSALSAEPELRRARDFPSSRPLLEERARSKLYEQFDSLRFALTGTGSDLRLPAVIWLETLYRLHEVSAE
jgi:hypothetical protein